MQKGPGSAISLWLGIAALLTVVFPILSLPCSISGLVVSRKARRFELAQGQVHFVTRTAVILNLACLICTLIIMTIALPGAVQRNLL